MADEGGDSAGCDGEEGEAEEHVERVVGGHCGYGCEGVGWSGYD